MIKYFAVITTCLLLLVIGTLGFVKKEIPEHLLKKYGVIDPKVDNRVKPDIKAEDLPKYIRDPTREKSEFEIPRVKGEIHDEDIPHEEHIHEEKHITEAMREHEIAKVRQELEEKKRQKERMEAKQKAAMKAGGDENAPAVEIPNPQEN
jgi:hypothetical protein